MIGMVTEKMAKKVMLDAGHGGNDYGAVFEDCMEKTDTLALAKEIGRILEDHGAEAVYTRDTDVYLTPFARAKLANDANADLFVSLHRNAFPAAGALSGAESYIDEAGGESQETAEQINQNLEAMGFDDLGVRTRPNIVVLNRTEMPAVLVQVGYLDSPTDNALFDGALEDIAFAIADGILHGIGMAQEADGADKTQNPQAAGDAAGSQNGELTDNAAGSQEAQTDSEQTASADENKKSERPDAPPRYSVQTGLFRLESNAERLQWELASAGFPARIVLEDGYYKVLVGDFSDMREAIETEHRLRDRGYATLLVTRQAPRA